jgi:iron complex transport system ATP-binding protein
VAAGLRCRLGRNEVLRGLDLHLDAGEILGILGPNGAGKSTLLRCLNGLLPIEGTMELLGRPIASLSPREVARISTLLHQNTPMEASFPASEVVMMGRYPHQRRFRPATVEDRRAVAEAMRFTDTSRIARQAFNTLSGGERQRVLLAKSLAQNTSILLLDEPSASLDIGYQDQIFRYAQRLAREGKTIAVAIHDLRLAARYCDRVILLSHGTMLAEGAPETVLTPVNLERAYGVPIRVYRNPMTGQLDFQLHEAAEKGPRPHLHVIGGGGSGAAVLRILGDGPYRVTTGVLNPGDTDLQVARFYNIPAVTSPPFSPIGTPAFDENKALAAEAQITILCNLAIGKLNLRNVEAAAAARLLVVLEDEDPRARDFTSGPGLKVYRRLVKNATVLKTEQLKDWLENSGFPSLQSEPDRQF